MEYFVIDISNNGERNGDEVVQLYITHPNGGENTPIRSLKGFKRLHLKASETKLIEFTLNPQD